MKFRLADGGAMVASTPSELIATLKQRSRFDFDKPNHEFMQDFARKLKIWNGSDIRTETVSDFINDLIASNYLIDIE